ncbi:MAG: DEAD/DEAH box helicase [Bacteroidetes bacterium]|jgi:ATP-dependent RNA helicase RhlE|nr:DEAD/DEAH box helicase [Bacteroidota bacterium]
MQKRNFNSRNHSQKRNGSKKFSKKASIDVNQYINKNLSVVPPEKYVNTHTFADFKLDHSFLQQITQRGYTNPTEIQDKSIPTILEGKDLIGIAGTGTGKTAAFLIPIIQELIQKPENQKALIITPTRELATQIFDEFRKMTKGLNLYTTSVIGGVDMKKSIKMLNKTNHVVIGTPGRLIDMVNRGLLPLKKFKTLVLDEFDRMLDMGFVKDIQYINDRLINKQQTLLFSATMDNTQQSIIDKMTKAPVKVTANSHSYVTHDIEQDVLHVPAQGNKFNVLYNLITENDYQKVILFCETKRKVSEVYKKLNNKNIRTDEIHGDKSQSARDHALRKFKKGHVNVLVATDVLARGIDVTDVALVVNYEAPKNYNDYVHRIGRTGRAGKTGKAITLIDAPKKTDAKQQPTSAAIKPKKKRPGKAERIQQREQAYQMMN